MAKKVVLDNSKNDNEWGSFSLENFSFNPAEYLKTLKAEKESTLNKKPPFINYLPFIFFVILWSITFGGMQVINEYLKIYNLWITKYIENASNANPELLFFWFIPLIFVFIWVFWIIKLLKRVYLINKWKVIKAKIIDIKEYAWRNNTTYVIASDWTNNFKSDWIMYNVYDIWEKISVYIDEKNPKNYWVDISWAKITYDDVKTIIKQYTEWSNPNS